MTNFTTFLIGLLPTEKASFVTFLLGLLLGNWLAIDRDKRKEFNEASQPIRAWLLKEKDNPSPFTSWPSSAEIDRFIHYLRPWNRTAFKRHLAHYKHENDAAKIRGKFGEVIYSDDTKVRLTLNKLFKYTNRR